MEITKVKLRNPSYGDKDSPFYMDWAVHQMAKKWEIMHAVVSGTEYLHENAETYLPREPREDDKVAWPARVNRSVLTPFVRRLISNAAGLVLRRPIRLEGGDPWWEETFRKDVDGDGTSLDQFAKKRLEMALTYGLCNMMVDAPENTAQNAAEEMQQGLRPYFVPIDPWQVLGWRRESDRPGAPLTMFRYCEQMKTDDGKFGEEYTTVARVIEPGRYSVYKDRDTLVKGPASFGLNYVPIIPIYADREGYQIASPPLADVARLNITHYQRLADLLHSLHIAAIGLLVLEDYDGEEGVTGLSYAIRMAANTRAYWVACDAGSFVAQADALDRLENQMSHLGVTKLLGQKFVAESADAKRIDQQQANSVMATVSLELENALNRAFQMAADYNGMEPPVVTIDKDFDYYRLLGQDVGVLGELERNGQLRTSTFLKILRSGEWLPDSVNIKEEEEAILQLKEDIKEDMLEAANPEADAADTEEPDDSGSSSSEAADSD